MPAPAPSLDRVDVPAEVEQRLGTLRVALDAVVPPKTASNLLIATWNLRAFGGLTPKWQAGPDDSPKRDWFAAACIAEVISRFDVAAIQEVRRDTTALRFVLDRLGIDWRVIVSDVTEGAAGNGERLTFLYHSGRVQPSGLVGEIVLPPSVASPEGALGPERPLEQFARSPYAAGFARGSARFVLTTVHVLWGGSAADRLPEITAFAGWMRDWADRPNDWNENLLVLGDFNLDRLDDPLFEAFVSTGLWPPVELNGVPRTVFDNDKSRHFYDQIAWFSDTSGAPLLRSLAYAQRAGSFDFVPHVFRQLNRTEVSWRISDHYPLWVEFDVDP